MTACARCRVALKQGIEWLGSGPYHPGCARVQREADAERNIRPMKEAALEMERGQVFGEIRGLLKANGGKR